MVKPHSKSTPAHQRLSSSDESLVTNHSDHPIQRVSTSVNLFHSLSFISFPHMLLRILHTCTWVVGESNVPQDSKSGLSSQEKWFDNGLKYKHL